MLKKQLKLFFPDFMVEETIQTNQRKYTAHFVSGVKLLVAGNPSFLCPPSGREGRFLDTFIASLKVDSEGGGVGDPVC